MLLILRFQYIQPGAPQSETFPALLWSSPTAGCSLVQNSFTHCSGSEKGLATHSSILAWRIPETEEPGGLPSMGSHRVGHD